MKNEEKMKILMKCGYCRRKRIFDVDFVSDASGLVFCSKKCENRFNKCLKIAENSQLSINAKNLSSTDLKIIKRDIKLFEMETLKFVLECERIERNRGRS